MNRAELIHLLFSVRGRINRAKMWLSFAIIVLGGFVTLAALIFLATQLGAFGIVFALPAFAMFPAMVWALFATTVKRLHDRDFSGWMILFFHFLSGIMEGWDPRSWFLFAVAFPISLWGFIEIYVLRGTVGENEFGPDPLDPAPVVADNPQKPAGG